MTVERPATPEDTAALMSRVAVVLHLAWNLADGWPALEGLFDDAETRVRAWRLANDPEFAALTAENDMRARARRGLA